MATKKQIAEQAMRILKGGNLKPDRNLDIREVMLALDQLRDQACRIAVYNNIKEGYYEVPDAFLTLHSGITISEETVTGLSRITLPVSIVDLPHNLGIYQISPETSNVADLETAFKIVHAGEIGLLSGNAATDNDQLTFCWPVDTYVYFKNLPNDTTTVTAILVQSGKEFAEDDDYKLPPDLENELLEHLIKLFSIEVSQPHDEAEDGIK